MPRYKNTKTQILPFFVALALTYVNSSPTWAKVANGPAPLAPLHFTARYDGSYGFVPLGRILLTLDDDQPGHYKIVLDTKSQGLVSWFSAMKSLASAEGISAAHHRYVPQLYHSGDVRKNVPSSQMIRYDRQGKILERKREPMDDPNWRPVVPLEQANTGVDPITAYLALRPKLYDMLMNQTSDISVRTYDGARLADMQFHFVRHTTRDVLGQPTPVIDTTIKRKILQGYTPKEQKKFAAGDPEIHVYFTDDAKLIPVAVEVTLGIGVLDITLAELQETKSPK